MINWQQDTRPFHFCHTSEALPCATAQKILDEIESAQSWKFVRRSFYEVDVLENISQYRKVLVQPDVKSMLQQTHDLVASVFGVKSVTRSLLHIHRFNREMYAGLHSDAGPPETRLIVFLERNWSESNGGQFILTRGQNDTIHFPTKHNTAVLLRTTQKNLHGVAKMQGGERFSLVFRLLDAD